MAQNPAVAGMLASFRSGATGGFPGARMGAAPEAQSPMLQAWARQQGLTGQSGGWGQVYAGAVGLPRTFDTFLSGQFSPMEPIYPVPIDISNEPSGRPQPRRFQYYVGWNLPVGTPGTEGVKLANFQLLRSIAEPQSVTRSCIELSKGDMVELDWDIVPTDDAQRAMQSNPKKRVDFEKRKAEVMEFFANPDPDNYDGFDEWLNALVEDSVVLDAVALYCQPAGGKGNGPCGSNLGALALLDGSTVRPLLASSGARPRPPQPAYQQLIWGVPRVDLMDLINLGPDATLDDIKQLNPVLMELTETVDEWQADQMIYFKTNSRSFDPYGFGPNEQAILPSSIMQARMTWQWEFFRSGSLPSVWLDPGESIANAQEARQLQESINMLGGDLAGMHQVIVIPPGGKVMDQKPVDLTSQFDEWMTALIVMPFGYSISDLGITPKVASMQSPQASKAAATTAADRSVRRAVIPRAKKMKTKIFDRIIRGKLGQADMQWSWGIEEQGESRNDLVTQWTSLVHGSIASIDEGRIALEMDPLGLPETTVPLVFTAVGATTLQGAVQQALTAPAPPAPGQLPPGGKPGGPLALPPGEPPKPSEPGGGPSTGGGKPGGKPAAGAKPKPGSAPSPAHAGSQAVTSSPADQHNSSEQKSVADELAQLRRYLRKGGDVHRFTPKAIAPAALRAARGGDVDAVVASVAKAHDRFARKHRALADPRAKVAAALGLLANKLANGAIGRPAFVAGGVAAMATGFKTAYQAGATTALEGAPAGVNLDPISDWTADAQTRADNQRSFLNDFAASIAAGGVSTAAAADRANAYSASLSRAYEEGYVTQGTNTGDDDGGGTAPATITWHLGDADHCENCDDLDGQDFAPDDLPGYPGDGGFGEDNTPLCLGGPMCFPAGTIVQGAAKGALRARYVGELVELRTASGAELAVTPNHPIATPHGFVPAGSLRQGDHVLSQAHDFEAFPAVDVEHGPARIEQVFDALGSRSASWSGSFRARGVDLHGDGRFMDGHVDVVGTDWVLLPDSESLCPECVRDGLFVTPDGHKTTVAALCMHRQTLRAAPASVGLPCSSQEPFGVGDGAPIEHAGLGAAPRLVTRSDNPSGERRPGHPKTFGQRQHGLSRFESGDGASNVDLRPGSGSPCEPKRLGPAAYVDVRLDKPASEDHEADLRFLREMNERFPGFVTPDEVIEVRWRQSEGGIYVYDLHTETGWQTANGILASNCACTLELSYGDQTLGSTEESLGRQIGLGEQQPADLTASVEADSTAVPRRYDYPVIGNIPKDFSLGGPLASGFVPFDLAGPAVSHDDYRLREVVERCADEAQARRVMALYDPAEYEVVGNAICAKTSTADAAVLATVLRDPFAEPKAATFVEADGSSDEVPQPAPELPEPGRHAGNITSSPAGPGPMSSADAVDTGVSAAGVAVRALDTGRVLMQQRALDPDDPASGKWEWPGGGLDPDETPWAAAAREFAEETGSPLPDSARVADTWTAGPYQTFLVTVPHEADVTLNAAAAGQHVAMNPDDPDRDCPEVAAWHAIEDLAGMPLRAELAATLPTVVHHLNAPAATKAKKSPEPAAAQPRLAGSSIDEGEVMDYLLEHYPDSDLGWVARCLWSADNVMLGHVDWEHRPGGIDEGKVDDMADKLADGWTPHPVVLVAPDADSEMSVADGYHRCAALAKAGRDAVAAWVGVPKPGNTGWAADIEVMQATVTNHPGNE